MTKNLHGPMLARVCLLVLALSAWTTAARAAEIRDGASGFSVTVDPPKAKTCIILPKESRDAGCAGLDVETIAAGLKALAQPPVSFALVRFEDWSSLITVTHYDVRTKTEESILATIKGSEDEAKKTFPGSAVRIHGDEPASKYDVLDRSDANVVRYQMDVDLPPTHPKAAMAQTLVYLVAGAKGTYMLSFNAMPSRPAPSRAFADSVIETLRWPGSKDSTFGQSRSYALGYLVGQLAVYGGVCFAGIVAIVVAVTRKKRAQRFA